MVGIETWGATWHSRQRRQRSRDRTLLHAVAGRPLTSVDIHRVASAVERLTTHPGHKFVAYAGDTEVAAVTVTADRGGWQEFEL